jgi:AraC-like DNA-binding protein
VLAKTCQEHWRLAAVAEGAGRADLAGSLRPLIRSLLSEGCTHADQIAQRAGISSRSLQRHLAEGGHTFSELLRQTRLEMALEMIRIGSRITDIGLELGYADTANFIRAFRSWTGLSPSAYRQQIVAEQRSPLDRDG